MTLARASIIGAAVVWAGIFLASAIVLQGTAYFGQLLPLLIVGASWFLGVIPVVASPSHRFFVSFMSAIVVWVALLGGTALILSGTPYLTPTLLVLFGGAVWFILIVPGATLGIRHQHPIAARELLKQPQDEPSLPVKR
jgi:hypothetical protein